MQPVKVDKTINKMQCQVCDKWVDSLRHYSGDIEEKRMCDSCAQEYCELEEYI
jgi:hypothetical protein